MSIIKRKPLLSPESDELLVKKQKCFFGLLDFSTEILEKILSYIVYASIDGNHTDFRNLFSSCKTIATVLASYVKRCKIAFTLPFVNSILPMCSKLLKANFKISLKIDLEKDRRAFKIPQRNFRVLIILGLTHQHLIGFLDFISQCKIRMLIIKDGSLQIKDEHYHLSAMNYPVQYNSLQALKNTRVKYLHLELHYWHPSGLPVLLSVQKLHLDISLIKNQNDENDTSNLSSFAPLLPSLRSLTINASELIYQNHGPFKDFLEQYFSPHFFNNLEEFVLINPFTITTNPIFIPNLQFSTNNDYKIVHIGYPCRLSFVKNLRDLIVIDQLKIIVGTEIENFDLVLPRNLTIIHDSDISFEFLDPRFEKWAKEAKNMLKLWIQKAKRKNQILLEFLNKKFNPR
jgi:hypothetical protein